METAFAQRIRERAHDVLLPDELREAPRAPFAGKNLGHDANPDISRAGRRLSDLCTELHMEI
jgi:hypothetical protein